MKWRVGVAAMWGLVGMATAADFYADPATYRDTLIRLQPGDRLLLKPGDYLHGLPLHELAGTAARPIQIIAAKPAAPPRLLARANANTISLVNVRYLVLRDLELDGRNLPVDAVKAEGHSRYADFITLENLHIHDYAASQQNVGISTKCPAHGWVVKNNRIERVGTGMYFGDSDGSAAFVAGLIEGNLITETLGYNLQIKHQIIPVNAGAHAEKTGETIIRHNVFSRANPLSGGMPRPNVLLGHGALTGARQNEQYRVYSNLFWQNPDEALFQGEGNLELCNNVFVNTQGDAIHIQPHHHVPQHVWIRFNTVWAKNAGITVWVPQASSGYRQIVSNNLIFARRPLLGGERADNAVHAYGDAARYLRRPVMALAHADFRLKQSRQIPVEHCPAIPSRGRYMPGAGVLNPARAGLSLPPPLK
ncbi:MAG: right-handed parallel beta-helix repeat-containing protein [Thiobacillus sp.]